MPSSSSSSGERVLGGSHKGSIKDSMTGYHSQEAKNHDKKAKELLEDWSSQPSGSERNKE